MQLTAATKKRQVLIVAEGQAYSRETEDALRTVDRSIYTVHLADAQSCLNHLGRCGHGYRVPDLLLLDLVLPTGPDGLSILYIVRRLEALALMPVLMVSNSAGESDHHVQARQAGASAVLTRPTAKCEYPEFARQICAWLAQNSWSESGPEVVLNALAARALPVSSPPAMLSTALPAASPGMVPALPDRSPLAEFERIKNWFVDAAEKGVDAFHRALCETCRRHKLRPAQMLRVGTSREMIRRQREVLVDLLAEGWLRETLEEELGCELSETEWKRLRKKAATCKELGPNLDRRLA